MKRIAVLGSTGSIGTNCLDVIRHHGDRMAAVGLTAGRQWRMLATQAEEFHPRRIAIADAGLRNAIPPSTFNGTEVLFGSEGVERIASDPDIDVVVAGIVGAAGLRGTWAAIEAGKTVGLANKETMVVAGPLVNALAARTGAQIIPVDSEHSAIHQALQAGAANEVRRVVLTASGGPFRGKRRNDLENVTPEMALAHPTWDMG
ncbi:MAG: 1-deoxy-D-xylulose-5-phosphate reductoisomerase, partial [Planctomycetota bacterium]|nr:1-deoxy-D-xylulose-5-phosphate reductoisomerase [Planctomycetota bacterium]